MEGQCIAVEAPSRLYVTDDFIVTQSTIAGIILDNAFQGCRRAVWISENRSLLRDHCATGSEVVACTLNGAHTWPGGPEPLGTQVIWAFFMQNHK